MFEIIFIILLFIYIASSSKIDEWITIIKLGFKTNAPINFLNNSIPYDIFRSAVFIALIATSFFMETVPWYLGVGTLFLAWLGAGWVGRKNAYNTYRKNFEDLLNLEDNTEEEERRFRREAKKTDEELADMVAGKPPKELPRNETKKAILTIEDVFELDDENIKSYITSLSSNDIDELEKEIIDLSFTDDYYFERYLDIVPEDRMDTFLENHQEACNKWDKENDPENLFRNLEVDWDFKPPDPKQTLPSDPESLNEHFSNSCKEPSNTSNVDTRAN